MIFDFDIMLLLFLTLCYVNTQEKNIYCELATSKQFLKNVMKIELFIVSNSFLALTERSHFCIDNCE